MTRIYALDKKDTDIITVQDFFAMVWRAKYLMIICVILLSLMVTAYIYMVTPVYRISMIVAPAEKAQNQFHITTTEEHGLVGGQSTHPDNAVPLHFHHFLNIMTGPSVAAMLLQDEELVDVLNKNSTRQISRMEDLADYLKKEISIQPIGASPLRRITFYHADPDFGVALLRKIHLVADRIIQKEDNQKTEKRIQYLRKNLQEILNPDHRKALTDLLMQQEHIFMLTNLDTSYAARNIEPPAATPRPVWPSWLLLYFLAFLGGVMLGYILTYVSRPQLK